MSSSINQRVNLSSLKACLFNHSDVIMSYGMFDDALYDQTNHFRRGQLRINGR